MKYRRKHPEVIEAIRYDGTNADAVADLCDEHGYVHSLDADSILFDSDGGAFMVKKGQWCVIVERRLMILTDESFRDTFEEIPE